MMKMNLKKVNLVYVILLYFFTGGIYAIYWFVTRGIRLYELEDRSKKRLIPYFIAIITIFYALMPLIFLVIGVDSETRSVVRIIFGLGFFALIAVYVAIAFVGADIANHIRSQEADSASLCSPRKAYWLSYIGMTSCIYLQLHINKLSE